MPIPWAVSPWRTEPDRRSAVPTVRKAMVVMCHVTWIIVLVIRGPPKRLDGSISGESFLTTRTSPPTPWMAAPRMATDPATISGPFTPSSPRSERSGGGQTRSLRLRNWGDPSPGVEASEPKGEGSDDLQDRREPGECGHAGAMRAGERVAEGTPVGQEMYRGDAHRIREPDGDGGQGCPPPPGEHRTHGGELQPGHRRAKDRHLGGDDPQAPATWSPVCTAQATP